MDLAAVDMDRGSEKTEAACDGSSIVDPVALQEITVDATSPSKLSTHQRSLVAGAKSACGETWTSFALPAHSCSKSFSPAMFQEA